jgi:cell division transport system permease protein
MLTALKRVIHAGWLGLKRQGGLAIATIFTMVMTISMITSLFLFQKITRFSVAMLEEKVDVSVYFKQTSPVDDILKLKDELVKLPEVKSVEYVSDEEAKQNLLEGHPDLADSLAETEGMLNLASLNIKAAKADQYDAIVSFLQNGDFKDSIQDIDYAERKPVIDKIFSVASGINSAGIIISLILALVSFLVAFNQVRLAIYNSCEEIFIQRLVGASNWFIRGPFLVQGVIAGFFASLIALLVFVPLALFLSPKMEFFFPGLHLFSYFANNFILIFLLQLLTGIGLGIVSSLIAMRRYLEV